MKLHKAMAIVVSLGGSMMYGPEGIRQDFLLGFKKILEQGIAKGEQFIIITGGGAICRTYQRALYEMTHASDEERDWLGIAVTHLNAELFRLLMQPHAGTAIIRNPRDDPLPDSPIIVGGGWQPGASTDHDAALLAKRVEATRIVNVSNVSHVYAADPRMHPDAKKFTHMTWDQLQGIIGTEWVPGRNVPFDPIAAKECRAHNISVAIVSGSIENIGAALYSDDFDGTLIRG